MTNNDNPKITVELTKQDWEAIAKIVSIACQLRSNDWVIWGKNISQQIHSQIAHTMPQVIEGVKQHDLVVERDTILRGVAAANVILRKGHLQVHGVIGGDLVIDGNATVLISGVINGWIVNHAQVPNQNIRITDQLTVVNLPTDSRRFRVVSRSQQSTDQSSKTIVKNSSRAMNRNYEDDYGDDGFDALRDMGMSEDDILDSLGD